MLTTGIVLFVLATQQSSQGSQKQTPQRDQTIKAVEQSGRCATVAENPDERVAPPKQLPAGKPPLLSFRLYETKAHHGNASGLMLDDAGH